MKIRHIYTELPAHPTKRYKARDMTKVDTIVLHHSASSPRKPKDGWQSYIDAVAKYHVEHNGWPGIAYHYVIDPDGVAYKCQPVKRRTYHSKGGNATGIGICLLGDFTTDAPGEVQLKALRELVADIRRAMPGIKHVIGHRDVPGSSTACPGNAFSASVINVLEATTC